MSEELLYKLIALFGAGAGLLFTAGMSLSRFTRVGHVHLALGTLASAGTGLVTGFCIPWSYAIASACIGTGVFGTIIFIKSSFFAKIVTSIQAAARRPACQATVLASIATVVMGGSFYVLVSEEEAAADADMTLMEEVAWRPETRPITTESAVTDSGNPIVLREPISWRGHAEKQAAEKRLIGDMRFAGSLIRLSPPDESHNCHGWVFTGGKYWLAPEDVERILNENKYEIVSEPRSGDVVIYRHANEITHTAIVRSPAANGRPVLVEGKWGWMGVYLHGIDDSSYGTSHTFYRSPREGHVLVGLGGRSIEKEQPSDRAAPQTLTED